MKKILNILGIIIIVVAVFWIAWSLRPIYDNWYGKKPIQVDTLTLEVPRLFEDTLKTNTLTRKLARYAGIEELYNSLWAKYQIMKPETTYIDTTKQKMTLNISFIIRIDKTEQNLDVYTYKITGIEGHEGNMVSKITNAVSSAIKGQLTAIGQTSKHHFEINPQANYQLFVGKDEPKLIKTRQLPVHLSLFLRPKYQILPDKSFFVNVGVWLKRNRWSLTGFYETTDKASVALTYELPIF